jgi:imidazolonepropionase-like amidohydrolase
MLRILFFFLGLLVSYLAWAQPIALTGARLIDPRDGSVASGMSLLIEDSLIMAVGRDGSLAFPPQTQQVDLAGKYVLPGLVDAHVHFFQSGGLYTRPDIIDLRKQRSYQVEMASIEASLKQTWARYLACGIMRVCDMGGPYQNFAWRDQAAATAFAPTLYVTGPLISSVQAEELGTKDPPILQVTQPAIARQVVRQISSQQPAYLKIWYIVPRGSDARDYLPVVEAVIEESHRRKLPVAVHATQLETARLAVQAGADILVHSIDDAPVDSGLVALMRERRVSYIPTLRVGPNYGRVFAQALDLSPYELKMGDPFVIGTLTDLRHLPADQLPYGVVQRLQQPYEEPAYTRIMAQNLARLYEAGVNVVAGTDAGNIGTLHGPSLLRELQAMEKVGLSPAQVLRSATWNAAVMLGETERWGSLEAGKVADMVVLAENPLENLKALQAPSLLFRRGQRFEPAELLPVSPETLAQGQLNAYNLRDLETFLSYYHPEVAVYDFPDQLQYQGKAEMRQRYQDFFTRSPGLHCELKGRVFQGKVVMDKEYLTGLPGDRTFEAAAIYTIEAGLIKEVRFVR